MSFELQELVQTGTVNEQAPVRSWRPIVSPFGVPVRMPHLERACEFAAARARRTSTSVRVVRERDGQALAAFDAASLRLLTGL